MRRRDFIALTGGAAVAWPFGVRAQKSAMPVIGFLGAASAAQFAPYVAGFRRGLNETGYVEGTNVAIEFRWAEGHYDRVPALAADLVRRQVAVIFTTGAGGGGADRQGGDFDHSNRLYDRPRPRRDGDQPQNREGAWPDYSAIAAAARGRGDPAIEDGRFAANSVSSRRRS